MDVQKTTLYNTHMHIVVMGVQMLTILDVLFTYSM